MFIIREIFYADPVQWQNSTKLMSLATNIFTHSLVGYTSGLLAFPGSGTSVNRYTEISEAFLYTYNTYLYLYNKNRIIKIKYI
jgi:hypothetical protein